MTRFALTIEFDGGPYMGWQWQDHGPSVQGAIEEAIFKTTGEKTLVYSAGRTDAGVHARISGFHYSAGLQTAAGSMQRSGVDKCGGNSPLAAGRYQSRLELQLMRPPGHYGASYLVPLRELVSVRRNAFSPSASASVAKVSLTAEICLQHKLHNHHAKSPGANAYL